MGGLAFSTVLPSGVRQDGELLTMTARAGFDGYCKRGKWLPVWVTVQNDGPSREVTIRITDDWSDDSFEQSIELPTGSRKAALLYQFPTEYGAGFLHVSLFSAGLELQELRLPVLCLTEEAALFGVIAASPYAFSPLAEVTLPAERANVAILTIDDIPDLGPGLDALDVLVFSDTDTGALTPAQVEALGDWMLSGGRLLVAGGAGWQRTAAGLQRLLPMKPSASVQASSIEALARWSLQAGLTGHEAVVATGELEPDSAVVVSQGGLPLLLRRRIGFGEVWYLAADPASEPLRSWAGLPVFFRRVLQGFRQKPGWAEGWQISASTARAAEQFEAGKLPSVGLICGLLVVYVLVAGPLHFVVLRRSKRRELAWATLPAVVIAFSAVVWLAGDSIRGRRPILNRLAIVQVWPVWDRSRMDGLVGIFSPSRKKYRLEAETLGPLHPVGSTQSYRSGSGTAYVQAAQRSSIPVLVMDVGETVSFGLRGFASPFDVEYGIQLRFDEQGYGTLQGSLTNSSAVELRDASLLFPGGAKSLGDLEPGETVDLSDLVDATELGQTYPFLSLVSYSAAGGLEDAALRIGLLESAWNPLAPSAEWATGVYLAGWSHSPLPLVDLAGQSFDVKDLALYVVQLRPELVEQDGRIVLPPGFFARKLTFSDQQAAAEGQESRFLIGQGTNAFSFRLASPVQFQRVESLVLHLEPIDPFEVQPPMAYLWDAGRGEWAALPDIHWGDYPVQNPRRYVREDGEILLRLDHLGSTAMLELLRADFTLSVSR